MPENLHGSKLIFVVGHYDCGGHPVDDETHKSDIRKSVENLKKLYLWSITFIACEKRR